MRRRKILFLIPTLGGGGAERVLVNLVNGMDRTRYDVTVQTLFRAGINASYLNEDVRFIEGRVRQFSGNVMLMKFFSPTVLFRHFIKAHYDVIVSYLEGVTARIASGCQDAAVKKLCWIHVEHNCDAATTYCFRSKAEAVRCYESFDKMVYVSRDVMRNFITYYPSLKANEVVYNTNNDAAIRKMATEPLEDGTFSEAINIVSVGRLIEQKGFERLLEVHHRLKQVGVNNHLYILGTGVLRDNLANQAIANGDADTVHLLGFCKNPYKIVARCDVFVCSSRREGFSTAVTEALILGIPVVTTDVSGAYEQMGKNNEYGIVTENTTNGIYEGLRYLLCGKGVLAHYKKQALERGRFFSREHAVRDVENLIETLY